jgi:hypothetical protein
MGDGGRYYKENPVVAGGDPNKHGRASYSKRGDWHKAAAAFAADPNTLMDLEAFGLAGNENDDEINRRLLAQLILRSIDESKAREVAPWIFSSGGELNQYGDTERAGLRGVKPEYQW